MNLLKISYDVKKYLVFGVLFFYLLGPVVRFYHAYISDIFFLLVFIIIAFSGTKLKFNSSLSKIFLIPIGIVLISVAGKYFSGYKPGSDEIANLLNYVKLFFLFVLVYSVFLENNQGLLWNNFNVIHIILTIFILFISIVGILQFANLPIADYIIQNFYHVVHKTGTDNIYEYRLLNRVTSIFDSFNGMGIVLCFTLFIYVYLIKELKNYWSISIVLLGLTLLFLTGNRASLITFVLMTIIYLIFSKKKISYKTIGIITGVFAATVVIFFFVASYLSFDNYIRFYEFKLLIQNGSIPPTLQVRLDKWQWLPSYILSVPQWLFGFTTNDFLKEKVYTSPDNQYLNWLVYYGYFGLTSFVIWGIYSLALLIKSKKAAVKNFTLRNAYVFMIIYWSGLIIIGLFQESFFFGRLRELFIFFLALISSYISIQNKNNRSEKLV